MPIFEEPLTLKEPDRRAYMFVPLADGNVFYPMNPSPVHISVENIAASLSRTPRFSAHTKRGRGYSVAEHCIRCMDEARHIGRTDLAPYMLAHDMHEALSGFSDVNSPMKKLCPLIGEIEDKIDMFAICPRFRLDYPSLHSVDVKQIDLTLLATEKRDLMTVNEAHEYLWGKLPPPLPERILKPMTYEQARREFIHACKQFGWE